MKNNIKEFRIKEGWTQNELAQKLKISRQTISLIERNKLTPSIVIADKIAKIFSKNIESVFIIND